MTELTRAQLIWNRALDSSAVTLLWGDMMLGEMLRLHGYVMNGGVFHLVENLTDEDMAEADAVYRYFGYEGVGDLLREAKSIFETDDAGSHETELNDAYDESFSDEKLFERFKEFLRLNPSQFAAL